MFDTSLRLLLIGNTKKTEFKKNREPNKQKTDDARKVSKKVQTVSKGAGAPGLDTKWMPKVAAHVKVPAQAPPACSAESPQHHATVAWKVAPFDASTKAREKSLGCRLLQK